MYFSHRNTRLRQAGRIALPLLVFMSMSALSALGQGSQVYLEFDLRSVLQQGTIKFVRSYPDEAATPAPSDRDALLGFSDDGAFKLVMDRQSVRFDQYGTYTFTVFVNSLKGKGTKLAFYIHALPQGTFGDLEDTVKFHLHHDGKDSSGQIPLPLHTVGSNDLLETVGPTSAAETIKLSGEIPPSIKLRSTLPNFGLQVIEIAAKPECGDCWKGLAPPADLRVGGTGRILTAKGQDTEILLTGRPTAWPSLRASSAHFKISDPHDKITLHVTYAPIEGGRIRSQDFVIPVRFSPSLWAVIVSMLVGIAAGVVMRRVLGQGDAFKMNQLAKVSAAVIVSEFILYVSISDTRPLVLFGFNADPTQPLTIALIAFLVSGGPTLKTWIGQVMTQLWELLKATQTRSDPGVDNPH